MEWIIDKKLQKMVKEIRNDPNYWKELIKLHKLEIKFYKQLINYYEMTLGYPYCDLNPTVKDYLQNEIYRLRYEIGEFENIIKDAKAHLKKSLKKHSSK